MIWRNRKFDSAIDDLIKLVETKDVKGKVPTKVDLVAKTFKTEYEAFEQRGHSNLDMAASRGGNSKVESGKSQVEEEISNEGDKSKMQQC